MHWKRESNIDCGCALNGLIQMDTLMGMQLSYDIAQTRKRENQIRVPCISALAAAH
jgi:hypothetical protein